MTPAQFDALFNVHLKGPYCLTQQLLPMLADGTRIVNISSGLPRFALPGQRLCRHERRGARQRPTQRLLKCRAACPFKPPQSLPQSLLQYHVHRVGRKLQAGTLGAVLQR
jgi:NAD(P)-dependent dehydrogenase (short-subunit alcohol dehydrogenase family)